MKKKYSNNNNNINIYIVNSMLIKTCTKNDISHYDRLLRQSKGKLNFCFLIKGLTILILCADTEYTLTQVIAVKKRKKKKK